MSGRVDPVLDYSTPPRYSGKTMMTLFSSTENDPELLEIRTNRWTRNKFQSPLIHCEIYFPSERASFGILNGGTAQWTYNRTLMRHWVTLEHDLSDQQHANAWALFDTYVGREFDTFGFYLGLLCGTGVFISPSSTFCSRIVAEVYTHPAVSLLRPCDFEEYEQMSPPNIYEHLQRAARHHQPLIVRLEEAQRNEAALY